MNRISDVVDHILATLRADLGTFDLSTDADAVKNGTYTKPPNGSGPFVCLVPPAKTDSVPYGTGPDGYVDSYEAELRVFAPVLRATTESRADRGQLLADEVTAALETAHATKGTYPANALWRTQSFRVSGTAPNPAADTAKPGPGFVALTIEFSFRRAAGSGA